jgi:4a-hydroxytetrahydrobiopterin dehydratase
MTQKLLTQKERTMKLKKLPSWKLNKKETEISRKIRTNAFVDGLVLSARIAVHAEILEHHPTIELAYGEVTITLTTHDAKGITAKDTELAHRIDTLIVD